ncbi:hypothetical protein GCM10029992_62510 [Glycomyces albus]
MADPKPRSDQDDRAAALRSRIEDVAAGMRVLEVEALAAAIEYTRAGFHRSHDGYSGLRDWVTSCFDFNYALAGQIARIARLGAKFTVLAEAALSGRARVDAVAYAVAKLDVTGLRVWARSPYAAPVPSPTTRPSSAPPRGADRRALLPCLLHRAQGRHSRSVGRTGVRAGGDAGRAVPADLAAFGLVADRGRHVGSGRDPDRRHRAAAGQLSEDRHTPPRQDQTDHDGVLPAMANRNAEAFHQLLASAGTDPQAPTRHGHTATLTLMADVEALQGGDTGRLPRLEGEPVSIGQARLLACEAGVVPMVFDYATGEVIEQSKELRLPNTALRRKLEAEQAAGCAWHGCGRPVAWCESHHIEHWIDGGKTAPENLILLCRFHHGRMHTGEWVVTKTGPGQAVIEHRADGTRDTDWDLSDEETPTGLFPTEWSKKYQVRLSDFSGWYAMETAAAAIKAAREGCRAGLTTPGAKAAPDAEERPEADEPTGALLNRQAAQHNRVSTGLPGGTPDRTPAPASPPPLILGERGSALEPIPFLPGPSGRPLGSAPHEERSPKPGRGIGPSGMSGPPNTDPEAAYRPQHTPAPRRRPVEPGPSSYPQPGTPPQAAPAAHRR